MFVNKLLPTKHTQMITKNGKVVPNSRSSKKHGTLELTGIPTTNGGCSIGGSSESPVGPPFAGDEMLVAGRGINLDFTLVGMMRLSNKKVETFLRKIN